MELRHEKYHANALAALRTRLLCANGNNMIQIFCILSIEQNLCFVK